MSKDFRKKLDLYREGKLNHEDTVLIEAEINKYISIADYLDNDDKEFMSQLKNELDIKTPAKMSMAKKINRKLMLKIVSLSMLTVLACAVIIPTVYFSILSILGTALNVDSKRFTQEHNFANQYIHMAFPEVSSTGGGNKTEFYKRTFNCNIIKGLGRKTEKDNIVVKYSFGKLIDPDNDLKQRLQYYRSEWFYAINSQNYFNQKEWNYLENAPVGTKAKIFVTFKHKLTPEKAKAALGDQYFKCDEYTSIDMLTYTGSNFVLTSINPECYYGQNSDSENKDDEQNFMNEYYSYDSFTHKEVMLFGLKEIKKYKNIADYISTYYTYDASAFDDIDNIISTVDKNGVQYVGAIISGDSKELLKLKENPEIIACRVDDIVVW